MKQTKQGVPDLNSLGPRKPPKRRDGYSALMALVCDHKFKCQEDGTDVCSRADCQLEVECTHDKKQTKQGG